MVVASLIYWPLGWIVVRIKHRNKEKRKKIIAEKYGGNFSLAGAEVVFTVFGIILGSLLFLFLIVFIGRLLYDLFSF